MLRSHARADDFKLHALRESGRPGLVAPRGMAGILAGMDVEEPASVPAGAAGQKTVTSASDKIFRVCLNPGAIASKQPHEIKALQMEFADWFPGPSC